MVLNLKDRGRSTPPAGGGAPFCQRLVLNRVCLLRDAEEKEKNCEKKHQKWGGGIDEGSVGGPQAAGGALASC